MSVVVTRIRGRGFCRAFSVSAVALLAACTGDDRSMLDPGGVREARPRLSDLPADDTIALEHVEAPVNVIRDTAGRPHVYAASVEDAMRVEGWLVASDRALQLEMLRRTSQGRLAELLGQLDPSTIDIDIVYRHIGLGRVARRTYEALPQGELKASLDAFADGITQYFRELRSGARALPAGVVGIPPDAFTDWTGADSLAIARLQSYFSSYGASNELRYAGLLSAARATFTTSAADPLVRRRAGLERDIARFAPVESVVTSSGVVPKSLEPPRQTRARAVQPQDRAFDLSTARGYLKAIESSRWLVDPRGFGSNGWVISGARSATGNALLANDPHLPLGAPSFFWPVALDVSTGDPARDLHVSGVAIPGLPGVLLGNNEHVAWGATIAAYDVTDVYAETLTPDGAGVIWNGAPVALETIDEIIQIQGAEPYTYSVKVVPHHGPVQPDITAEHTVNPPDPARGALSVRWTGLEPARELEALMGLSRAQSIAEARTALETYDVGAQNWLLADTSGNVAWTSHAKIPIRDPRALAWDARTYSGTLPCFVLPGDGSAEWTGYLTPDVIPGEENPPEGFIANANNDPTGDTLDDDPSNGRGPNGTSLYLSCAYDVGFRQSRILERLRTHPEPLSLQDLQSIQGDVRSPLGAALTPTLLAAIDRAELERTAPGSAPHLASSIADRAYVPEKIAMVRSLLEGWGAADYEAAAGVDLETNQAQAAAGATEREVAASQATLLFNAWLVRVVARVLGDELERLGQNLDRETEVAALLHLLRTPPSELATYDPESGDSALWDDLNTPELETRDECLVRALLDALAGLEELAGPDLATYRWGAHHTIRFNALLPLGALSIPPEGDAIFPAGFPRHGDSLCVDQANYEFPTADEPLEFGYTGGEGAAQRFVIELDGDGPRAFNALPGGSVWDSSSPHFDDGAQLWRTNSTRAVPFSLESVIAQKETRTLFTAP